MNRFNLSALAVRQPSVTLFLIIVIVVAGIYAFFSIGRAEDPKFSVKTFTVVAAWPGATAQQMQDLVADPIEKQMQQLGYYDYVEEHAYAGRVIMKVKLRQSMPAELLNNEFYQARKKLYDIRANFPNGVLGPFVNDEYTEVEFALFALQAPSLSQRQLVRIGERIRQQFLTVPGIRKATLIGERPERIYVSFDWQRLATLGVPPQQLFDAISNQNDLVPTGSIDTLGPRVQIRVDGDYHNLDQIRATPITANGRTFKLSEIAHVSRGYQDPPQFLLRNNGQPAIEIGLVMRDGWDGLKFGDAIEDKYREISGQLPLGVKLSEVTNQAVNIRHAVDLFLEKFVVALAVVMLVSLLSLGWRTGIVVAAAVPLTLSAVLVVMLVTGRVLDRVTLGALILSLGLLVDDAIIAVEMMVVKLEQGWKRVDAAAHAWTVTAAPMLSGTLLTIIGFLPVGFAKSNAGAYAGNIFWVLGFALILSWIVAVYFAPYLGVKLLPELKSRPHDNHSVYDTPIYRRFTRAIDFCIRRKLWVVAVVVGLFVASVLGMGLLKQQFFPSSDRPEVMVDVRLPAGSSISTTEAAVKEIETWLARQPETRVQSSYIGQGAPRFFLSLDPVLPDPAYARMVIRTDDETARDRLTAHMRRALADGLAAAARVRVDKLVFGPPVTWPVEFRVAGADPDVLRPIAAKIADVMRANPNTRDINIDWGTRVPTQQFVIDPQRLSAIGLSRKDVAQQLAFLTTGVELTRMREGIREPSITARSAGWQRQDPAALGQLNIVTQDGRRVPLTQIGKIVSGSELPNIVRHDRIPTMSVGASVAAGLEAPEVSGQVNKALRDIRADLPAGYHITVGGLIEESNIANRALAALFPLMLLLMLSVIMLQVRSFSTMIMVFLTAPLGLVGAVPMLLIFNIPFGFNAIIGLIALSGILMRNTLILVEQIRENLDNGESQYEAALNATVQRTRPVLLTALAAVLAFIPLTLSTFYGALAYTLIGGVAVGSLLTVFFLPALYATWFRVGPPSSQAKA